MGTLIRTSRSSLVLVSLCALFAPVACAPDGGGPGEEAAWGEGAASGERQGEGQGEGRVAARGLAVDEESQCGPTLDFQDVEQYNGAYPVSVDFVQRRQRAVGQIQWESDLAARYDDPGNVNGQRWCSGTLIAPNLFLTAGHCFDTNSNGWQYPINDDGDFLPPEEAAREMKVNFNYQENADGVVQAGESFAIVDLVEHRLGGLDYAIVRLAGNPGLTYGVAPLSTASPDGADVGIIGHPNGMPKKISAGTLGSHNDTQLFYGNVDTLGGSSGSGVLLESTGAVIGVHTNGGCFNGGGSNSGVRLAAIRSSSPTIDLMMRSDWAFAYSSVSNATHTAVASYSRNSSGGVQGKGVDNTVNFLSTGRYRVDFPGLGDVVGGNAQVTAHGTGNERCKLRSLNVSGGDVQAFVDCYTPAGAPANSRFIASYVKKGASVASKSGAYLLLTSPSATTSTPSMTYQWNSQGHPNRVDRTSTGAYRAILPGQAPADRGGTVQVTAHGATSAHCKVASWGASGTDVNVSVRCFDAAGAPVDAPFSLFYSPTRASGGLAGGHAWADQPATAAYSPSADYEYISINSNAAHVSATRSGTGVYALSYPELASTGSSALVTAYGTTPDYCKVASWLGDEDNTTVNVRCFNAAGAPVDSRFVSNYATDQLLLLPLPIPIPLPDLGP
jgi:V8-like Glu-specific endopeptidase